MPCVLIIYLYYTSKINIIHSFNPLIPPNYPALILTILHSTLPYRPLYTFPIYRYKSDFSTKNTARYWPDIYRLVSTASNYVF